MLFTGKKMMSFHLVTGNSCTRALWKMEAGRHFLLFGQMVSVLEEYNGIRLLPHIICCVCIPIDCHYFFEIARDNSCRLLQHYSFRLPYFFTKTTLKHAMKLIHRRCAQQYRIEIRNCLRETPSTIHQTLRQPRDKRMRRKCGRKGQVYEGEKCVHD